ncbi:MAG: DUF885 family protein [Thermoanaerobaculia bacterium]
MLRIRPPFRVPVTLLVLLAVPSPGLAGGPEAAAPSPDGAPAALSALVEEALAVKTPTQSAEEYRAAAESYRGVLDRLGEIDRSELGFDDAVDADLLERHVRTRLFEIEDLRLHELVPGRYLSLYQTSSLFLRPCAHPAAAFEGAVEELERLPEVLGNARETLTRPAREWTEYALGNVYWAKTMLAEGLHELRCDAHRERLEALRQAAGSALEAVEAYERWLREVLLPRSDRPPAWAPEEIDVYQRVHEGLEDWDTEAVLALAEEELPRVRERMEELARRIHPSGDLRTVWELMKEEAPPWAGVRDMAARYVEMSADWLETPPGREIVAIPEALDYGVALTPPMARRLLSFGGASYGPTVAGRLSGYYVITPPRPDLPPEERASRLKSYNPYWTHVISYHEWLGHNVQRALAEAHVTRPMRAAYRGIYLSQAWSFYLEALLPEHGYYDDTLPTQERLKTEMARLQMRMWRIQRIVTKLRMARGEMSFDEAVRAYVEEIGMEPGNALLEVQRDSQTPSPPAREILGERLILEMRDEYRERMGEHYRMEHFHEALLSHGELPLPAIRRLIFRE